jgi:hypothetical protein
MTTLLNPKVSIPLFLLVTLIVTTLAIAQVKAAHPKIDSVLGGTLPDFQTGIERTPAYDKDEITATPNKIAAYNAGYSHGYLGLPLGKHHTEQFILGEESYTFYIMYSRIKCCFILSVRSSSACMPAKHAAACYIRL